jgi:hypothetical protein
LLIRMSCCIWRKAVGVYQNRQCHPFAQLGHRTLDAAERQLPGPAFHRRATTSLGTRRNTTALIVEAIGEAGFTPGQDIALAIDAAASEFYADGAYHFEGTLTGCRVLCAATHRGVIT